MENLNNGLKHIPSTVLAAVVFIGTVVPFLIQALQDFSRVLHVLELVLQGNVLAIVQLGSAVSGLIGSIGLLYTSAFGQPQDNV